MKIRCIVRTSVGSADSDTREGSLRNLIANSIVSRHTNQIVCSRQQTGNLILRICETSTGRGVKEFSHSIGVRVLHGEVGVRSAAIGGGNVPAERDGVVGRGGGQLEWRTGGLCWG